MILKAFWQHKIDMKRLFKGRNVSNWMSRQTFTRFLRNPSKKIRFAMFKKTAELVTGGTPKKKVCIYLFSFISHNMHCNIECNSEITKTNESLVGRARGEGGGRGGGYSRRRGVDTILSKFTNGNFYRRVTAPSNKKLPCLIPSLMKWVPWENLVHRAKANTCN